VDGCELGGQKLSASYGMTKYCSYYLEDQNCRNENCLFLHKAAAKEDSFSLYDKHSRGYPTRSSKSEIFELIESLGLEFFSKYRANIRRISEKMTRDANNDKQFLSSDSDSEINEQLPSPLNLLIELKNSKPKLFITKEKLERENQSLKPVLDKEVNPNVNKSWHFSLVKQSPTVKTSKPIKKSNHI
jgi:hypothetical protein